MPSASRFVNRLRYQLDFPDLKCETCRESYAEGELADAEGKMVYLGGIHPMLFQCAECPNRLYGEEDATSQMAKEIWHLLCESLVPDHPPPLDFLFKLVGLRVGSPESREVYGRLLDLRRILKEHEALTKGEEEPSPNGQPDEDD